MDLDTNPQLELARAFLRNTGENIFLTGKAGTGKTTFLHQLRQESPKRMVVVAPTGVAAINAGGVTIHSFFQFSLGPQVPGFLPGEERPAASAEGERREEPVQRYHREKISIFKSLDLLVIDEISMVRADLLEGIEGPFDLIVANPPYVPTVDAPGLQPEVREYEPPAALFAGEDGLQIVRRLVVQAAAALARDGILVFEFGAGQDDAVRSIVRAVSSLTLLELKHDLQDIPRAAVAQKTGR